MGTNPPKVNRLEALEEVKSDPELNSIPVVMLTTSERGVEVTRSYDHWANSYITKSVSYDEFVRRAREVKLHWALTNTPPSLREIRPTAVQALVW